MSEYLTTAVWVNVFADIRDFHEKHGLAYHGPPRELDPELEKYRMGALDEEHQEVRDAKSDEEKFDGLIDEVYFILGYFYLRGWNFEEAWRRVHRANMLKQRARPDASDSKRGSSYDVIKPEGWAHPSLADLVTPQQEGADFLDWDVAMDHLKKIILEIVGDDRPFPSFPLGLGSVMRLRFKPLLDRHGSGERSQELFDKIQSTCKEFKRP